MNTATTSPGRVLIVEDEALLRDAMVTFLKMEGLAVEGVGTLHAAKLWRAANDMDLMILDLGLPDGDALKWLKTNPAGNAGLIISTALGHPQDRIAGMQAGADAYLVKPVQLEELSLLAHKLLKRIKTSVNTTWILDKLNWTLANPAGHILKLTHSETLIILKLSNSPGKAVSKNDIAMALGHQPASYDMRRMEILIRRLRNKARENLGIDLPLETAHRYGYAFTAMLEIR
jgi:two-component system OmpR family response regulator